MVKEDSIKREYMTPEEVRKHSENYHRLGDLFSIGTRRKLLSKGTKDSIKQVMGEIAIDEHFKTKGTSRDGEDISDKMLKEFANQVRFLHDVYRPDYVFLTETSSTPMGYILKEAWKKAYPGERPPVFLRIIPGRGSREFFEKRIKDKDSKIFVYDEFVETGGSLISVGRSLKRAGYENVLLGKHGDGGVHLDSRARYGDKPDFSTPGYFFKFEMGKKIKEAKTKEEEEIAIKERRIAYKILEKAHFGQSPRLTDFLGKVTYKGFDKVRYSGDKRREVKGDVGEISGSPATVHVYKTMGKYVGEYILSEAQKRENDSLGGIEKKVATASVLAFAGGMFLLGSGITGNAIANLSNTTSNSIGIILFLIGIIFALFYFRRR